MLIDKAEVLSKLSRYEDANITYNKALAIQPSNLTILFDKANLLPYLRKYEDAISVYDTILTLNLHSSNAMGRKGLKSLLFLGRLEEAISYFDKVLGADSDNSAVLYYKVSCFG